MSGGAWNFVSKFRKIITGFFFPLKVYYYYYIIMFQILPVSFV